MVIAERLESRRLLSGTITADVTGNGTLQVHGTNGADTIDVFEVNGLVTVVADGDAANPIFVGTATSIKIDSEGGNDQIGYTGNSLDASIYLKNGDDFAIITVEGTGSARVFGGNGDDIVVASGNVTFDGGHGENFIVTV